MSRFYFFTDIDLLDVQLSGQTFGPKSNENGKNRFQVTSWHTAAGDPSAYAVCNGIICVQPQDNSSSLVNLVIKPLAQIPFCFPKVKYFIYKGIKIDSLIDGNYIKPANTNDLTEAIWTSNDVLNSSIGSTDDPKKEILGIENIGSGFSNSDPIDNLFYKEDDDFRLPVVRSGWKIGEFNSLGFGLDILVETMGFDHNLSEARKEIKIIEINELAGSPTQPETFEHWHDKEAILNYIDPCAFFGSFFNNELRVKSSTNGGFAKKNKNELYDDVISKFDNKNIAYIDLRNEFGFSINYFGNYGNNVKVAFEESGTLINRNYYGSDWPLLVIANSDFPANNSSNKNVIKISLPVGDGDNPEPLLYISAGFLNSDYPQEIKKGNKLLDLSVSSNFTDEIKLVIPNRSGGNTTVVSSYTKLIYNKKFNKNNPLPASSGTVIRAQHFLDNLFVPLGIKIPNQGDSIVKSIVYDTEHYLDTIDFKNNDSIVSIGKAVDEKNIIFFAKPKLIHNRLSKQKINTIPYTRTSGSEGVDFWELFPNHNNSEVKKHEFELLSGNITYLDAISTSGFSTENIIDTDLENFYSISIDLTEWDEVSSLINNNFLIKYKVFFALINPISDIDEKGYDFQSFDLALRGYELEEGVIQVKEVNTNIKIYTNAIIVQ